MWVRAWTEMGLDYYQAHYYPSGEAETRRTLAQQLASLPALDRSLWLGEVPARDLAEPGYSLTQALDACRNAGLCGAAVWRWTKPSSEGTDVGLGRIDPAELLTWTMSQRTEGRRAGTLES
jgi:hypothetical protein